MRVLVYPHDLGIGGSQLNAVELAAAVRDLGHEALVFGRPGPLTERIAQLGLEFVPAPDPGRRPSARIARELVELVDRRGIDLVHGYEWPPTLDAVLASWRRPVPLVATVMSMAIPGFIPRRVPLVVGTEEIADHERRRGRRRVEVIEPPVDLAFNRRGPDVDAEEFRHRHGVRPDALAIVSVTRFARELKLEGTLAAIEVVAALARRHPVQLVLVGDGPARAEVQARADAANAAAGSGTVILTGRLDDPRPAYAAADIALGMGGSALRALAFGVPLVVQGERGFWRTLTPATLDGFLWTGWYGIGEGEAAGPARLTASLDELVADRALRDRLGAFGLDTVRGRFSLAAAGRRQLELYRSALEAPRRLGSDLAGLARYSSYYAGKRIRRARGTERSDDFNARPVAALAQNAGVRIARGAEITRDR